MRHLVLPLSFLIIPTLATGCATPDVLQTLVEIDRFDKAKQREEDSNWGSAVTSQVLKVIEADLAGGKAGRAALGKGGVCVVEGVRVFV
ncbi:hypothetical protein RP726_19100 [Candidatus Methylospira mobilis]|uniref:hypothetical protein n=1 Tax=Candidatus Methylospira mobilis TaxID=1808979 RepID=UPI0028E19344|nr:hypothetical protein [Candidatus Methylospira mobilis]WNV04481.1 hypothetical protein RP726_19100 [Candidatus Methylospira mobilis]